MSRHQNIRNMNLADELGDYDYDYDSGDYEDAEGMSARGLPHCRAGTIGVC